MKKVLLIILVLLSFTTVALAESESSIFNLPDHKGLKDGVKPLNLEEMTDKAKKNGEKLYVFMQTNSVMYLLVCFGIGLAFLLVGIVVKVFRAVAGFAFFAGIAGFALINFAPDLVNQFVHWVSGIGK